MSLLLMVAEQLEIGHWDNNFIWVRSGQVIGLCVRPDRPQSYQIFKAFVLTAFNNWVEFGHRVKCCIPLITESCKYKLRNTSHMTCSAIIKPV